MTSPVPAVGDLISFTHEQYPQHHLVGSVAAVNQAATQLDVEACLSASDDGATLVAFAPRPESPSSSPRGISPAERAADLQNELTELRERRDVLGQDVEASHVRIDAIDVQIVALQDAIKAAADKAALAATPGSAQAAAAAEPTPEMLRADNGLAEARKALQSSLKTATAEWTKLQTVGASRAPSVASKTDSTPKILKGPPAPKEAVELVEAALAILNSKSAGTTFRGAQDKLPEIIKKCSMLKADHVKGSQLKRAEACLSQYTSAALAKRGTPAALVPLYTWLKAISASVKAREQQQQSAATAPGPRKSASPDPIKPVGAEEKKLQAQLLQLTQERKEHLDYIDLAEDELEAMDGLLLETEAAAAAATSPSRLVQQTHTMRIGLAQVVAVLPREDRTVLALEKAALMAPGTAVTLPHQTMALILGQPQQARRSTSPKQAAPEKNRHVDAQSPAVPTKDATVTTAPVKSSRPGPLALPAVISKTAEAPHNGTAAATSPLSADERSQLQARIRDLESSLNLALHKNPSQAEVLLLREELKAKASDLERLTEERDRLLQEKRERPRGSTALLTRAKFEPDRDDGQSPASGAGLTSPRSAGQDDGGFDSTMRARVDRRVADELEEQLNAAHQRIRDLEKQVSADARAAAAAASTNTQQQQQPSQRRVSEKTQEGDMSGTPQSFVPVGMLSRTLPTAKDDTASLQSGGIGGAESEQAEDSGAKTPHASPANAAIMPVASSFVSPDVQQQFDAQLAALQHELEQQKKQTMMAEERLNLALHSQQEVQQLNDAQKKEMKTLWKRLEDAEALLEKERFQAAIAMRRQSMLEESGFPSVSPSLPNATASPSLPNVMPMDDLSTFGGIVPTSKNATSLTRANAGHNNNNNNNASSAAGVGDANASLCDRSSPSLEVITANDPLHASASMGGFSNGMDFSGRRFSAPPGRVMSVGRRDTRSMSGVTSMLSSAPVEQMTPVELRHEVRNLRGEVERLQSSERRLMTELSDLEARQKEDRRQRREARRARMNMMSMMEKAVTAALVPPEDDEIQKVLSNARSETESIRSRNPSGMSYKS